LGKFGESLLFREDKSESFINVFKTFFIARRFKIKKRFFTFPQRKKMKRHSSIAIMGFLREALPI
jgi:hypothetical protein